jgi:hypothetical protein
MNANGAYVLIWLFVDVPPYEVDVRFAPNSGHCSFRKRRPLMTHFRTQFSEQLAEALSYRALTDEIRRAA